MDYIINEEILDWINTNKTPINSPTTENNFNYDDVGDWDGEEELAISQLNWVMLTLELTLNNRADKRTLSTLKSQIWKDWSKDTRILDAKKEDVIDYVRNLIARYSLDYADDKVA